LTQQTILNTLKNNFLDTFTKFLKQLKVPVTKSSALEFLETHPDEGSMLAYSDALNYFKIENAAVRITPQDLISLPTPFIAFSQIHGGTFSVVKNLSESTIEWFDTQKGWVNSKLEEFTNTWSGVVLLAETDEQSGEKNYTQKRREEILSTIRVSLAIGLLVLIFLFFVLQAPVASLSVYLLLALKAAGMVISTLLFIKSIDNANSLVNKLCNAGSKISCQSILDSPAAKITPWFSWSDAGFIYFFGSFLGLLLSLYDANYLNTYLTVQLIFSGFALIFSTYSLYYQGMKAKMWCTLCLGVVSIFFIEGVLISSATSFSHDAVDFQGLANVFIGLLLPIAFLLIHKNTAIIARESLSLKKELTKLKSNPQIFEALMANQRQMPEIPADMQVITIGNLNAKNTITMVSNPLCTPCAHMHARIERVIQENENLKCQIVFLASIDDKDPGGKFVRKLFALPKSNWTIALGHWFGRNDKNFDRWNVAYSSLPDGENLKPVLIQHQEWANEAEARATPTLFYNSRLFPNSLKMEDLTYQNLALNVADN
jgi:uncharacterized membrane protein